eukprot:NODE_1102_length_1012_cov_77.746893_g1057_i0.p1 GENE.NODE_1102_length_1012_cov_77.746893_g1057_i0~~NODE_1102_length_1012_cov_77.746893_g1057_i0.p1  ORF type:complete len:293 (-),score=8.78 NODE_1102_length_1012_cov_77.746893_g1057_i0:73-951(-)
MLNRLKRMSLHSSADSLADTPASASTPRRPQLRTEISDSEGASYLKPLSPPPRSKSFSNLFGRIKSNMKPGKSLKLSSVRAKSVPSLSVLSPTKAWLLVIMCQPDEIQETLQLLEISFGERNILKATKDGLTYCVRVGHDGMGVDNLGATFYMRKLFPQDEIHADRKTFTIGFVHSFNDDISRFKSIAQTTFTQELTVRRCDLLDLKILTNELIDDVAHQGEGSAPSFEINEIPDTPVTPDNYSLRLSTQSANGNIVEKTYTDPEAGLGKTPAILRTLETERRSNDTDNSSG